MINLPDELPRNVVLAWRKFLETNEAQVGIEWLRQREAPKIDKSSTPAMIESAVAITTHHDILNKIGEVLTALPKNERSTDDPGLVTTTPQPGDAL